MRKNPEAPADDPLAPYRRKRSAARTPEPFGPVVPAPPGRPGRFVVQQHAARRLHWDFRLEMGGVLVSWAVPKGPSPDPAGKRLAVAVEDHPLDYAAFEGMIPAGNYGAGPVIVWDQGFWTPVDDPADFRRRGKLLFDLHGYKLHGRWTLVKTRRSGRDWLLIKKADGFATKEAPVPGSILSGRTLDDLREGNGRAEAVRARLPPARRRSPLRVEDVELMLASPAARPFSSPDWIYELKYDGYRLLAARDGTLVRLRTRGGRDVTATFPEIARALASLPWDHFILDGEVVVLDERGHPVFQRLQQRVRRSRASDVDRGSVELPATFYAFDLLALDGVDLRRLPLLERKQILADVVPPLGPLRYADHVEGEGEALFERATAAGLEGIVAKRRDAPYHGRRSPAWKKIRIDRSDDFAVIGFTRPKGSRTGFGALHLAQRDDGARVYAGRVGSGFDEEELARVARRIEGAPRADPPRRGAAPEGLGQTWIEPVLVCEVRFRERTTDGLLRQPVFLRFREDKRPEECRLPGEEAEPPPAVTPARPEVVLSNPDKIFWPDEGYTKRDLFEYYRAIAPAMLPYLRDRPVVLTRFPDGITGKSFYQKDAPGFVPPWIRTERTCRA